MRSSSSKSRTSPESGGERDATPYQPLVGGATFGSAAPTPGPLERTGSRGRCCCFNTQGRAFNFVVGVVILFSAVLLCLEADLGKLGVGSGPAVDLHSLTEDLRFAGLTATERAALHDEIEEGLKEDAWLKKEASDFLEKKLGKEKVPDLQAGASPKEAYTVCEYFVVLFFLLEMTIRFCDRCGDYCADPWFGLDFLVVLQGALDLTLPFLASTYASFKASGPGIPGGVEMPSWNWILSLCRLMRVLRVLRVLRLSPRLRFLARDFARAVTAAMWVGITVLLTNLVCSILITSLIGQRSYQWGDKADRIDEWFGSVSRAMHTLFSVMTLSGWTEIDEVVSEVVPPVAVSIFFVLYLGVCFFASLSLVAGLIGDTFMKSQLDIKEKKKQQIEEQRMALSIALEDLLARDSQMEGLLSREGFAGLLSGNPVIFDRLLKLGIRTDREELDGLFERLLPESDRRSDGLVRIEVLAEAMVTVRSDAKAEHILDLKLLMRSLRRELEEHAERSRKEASERHQEILSQALHEQQQSATDLKEQVASLQNALVVLQDGLTGVSSKVNSLAAIKQQLDQRDRREERDKAETRDALASVHEKLDAMTGKIAVQLTDLSMHMVQVEAKVDSAVTDIADVSTRLGDSVNATREDTIFDAGAIENSVDLFSGRGSISMWREDLEGGSDSLAGVSEAVRELPPPQTKASTVAKDAEVANSVDNVIATAIAIGATVGEAEVAEVQPDPRA